MSGWYTRVTSAARATKRADLDAAVDHHEGTEAVDRHGAERTDEPEGDEEHPSEQRRLDSGVAHAGRPSVERLPFAAAGSEQLHEGRTRDVEALGHLGVHRGVVAHLLAGDGLEPHARRGGRG